jgi:predicted nucleic acid-binding protein
MKSMNATFVDTNVFVYWLDVSEPKKRDVVDQWLKRLWRDQSGRTSVQVVNELYVTLTRKIKHRVKQEDAWDTVRTLFAWEPQPTNRELVVRAREIERRFAIGWWDSLIVAAAQLQACQVLLTEDLQHGMRFGDVFVRNPFEPAVEDSQVSYEIEALPSRHRPRGRPTRRKVPAA